MVCNVIIGSVLGTALAGALLVGCASQQSSEISTAPDESVAVVDVKGAAQIWEENCARCHNSRSPKSLSDAQWDIAMLHMRQQASLTGEETRAVLKLMKASN